MNTNRIKNITRFDYRRQAFEGWRVAVARRQAFLALYFPDRRYGGRERALEAALACKAEALELANREPAMERKDLQAAFDALKEKFSPERDSRGDAVQPQ